MKHLLITDLDGTLLGPDSRVSDDSARIITELTHKGALITVATARTPATVEPLLHNTLTTLPAIVMTGAAMWDRENRLYINPLLLSRQQTESLISAYLRHGVHPFTYTLEDNGDMLVHHCKEMSDEEQMFYVERKHLTLKHFIFDNEQCHTSPYTNAILMLGIGDTPRIKALAEELSTDQYPPTLTWQAATYHISRSSVAVSPRLPPCLSSNPFSEPTASPCMATTSTTSRCLPSRTNPLPYPTPCPKC